MAESQIVWIALAGAIAGLAVACGIAVWIVGARARGALSTDAIRTRLADADSEAAILEGLERLSRAPNRKNWADIVSSTLTGITGTSGAAVILRAPGTDSMSLAGSSVPLVIRNLEGTLREPHGPSRRALSSAEPVAMSAGELPAWAAAAGYEAGVVFPIQFHGASIGLAYALGKPWQTPTPEAVATALRFITLAAPHYCVAGPFAAPVASVVPASQPTRPSASALPPPTQSPTATTVGRTQSRGVPALGSHPPAPVPPATPSLQAERRRIDLPGIVLDPRTERCVIDGRAVALSRTEFDLLYVLASSRGEVVTTDRLLLAVWGAASTAPSSALDVTIHRVRKKLERAPGGSDLVRTVRGKGYAIAVPDPAGAEPASAAAVSAPPGGSGSAAAAG
jgi:DNA-binding winged helix-turn-helix (wHTH) protein